MFKGRFYKSDDYPMLKDWWAGHRDWTPVPEEMLPNLGVIVSTDDKDLCAGFLYITNSKMCLMEWVVSNPKAPREGRGESIDFLLEALKTIAKEKGYSVIFTMTGHPVFKSRLVQHGFQITDENMTHLVFKEN